MIRSPKLVARYRELKAEAAGCLLLMQVGSFLQVMDEDARTVSALTGLKLQMAGEVDDPEGADFRRGGSNCRRPNWQSDFGRMGATVRSDGVARSPADSDRVPGAASR